MRIYNNYVNRMTIDNMYYSNAWILSEVGIKSFYGPRKVLSKNFDFNPLIKLTRLKKEDLLKLTFYYEFEYDKDPSFIYKFIS